MINFYDGRYLGAPAQGQLISFDSLLVSKNETKQYSKSIRLRPDTSFSPGSLETHTCFNTAFNEGISEYKWSRTAEWLFGKANTLHVGIGNTDALDSHIRYSLYRCLSTLPNTAPPRGSSFVDLLTIGAAIEVLSPECSPLVIPKHLDIKAKREVIIQSYPDRTRAHSIMQYAQALLASCPDLTRHAIATSSPQRIGAVMGLENGKVACLANLQPIFVCHGQLFTDTGFGIYITLGTDPHNSNVVYLIDLQSNLNRLAAFQSGDLEPYIRNQKEQVDRPIVRLNLARAPFVLSVSDLSATTLDALGIDSAQITSNAEMMKSSLSLSLALLQHSSAAKVLLKADPDYQLYGAEYSQEDTQALERLHRTPPYEWQDQLNEISDIRIRVLGERLINRRAPVLLDEAGARVWQAHCAKRLTGKLTSTQIESLISYCRALIAWAEVPKGMKAAAMHWVQTLENADHAYI